MPPLRDLHRQGKPNPLQEEILFSPIRPAEELYDAYELNTPAGKARKQALLKNSALMKEWAKEGK